LFFISSTSSFDELVVRFYRKQKIIQNIKKKINKEEEEKK